MKVIYSKSNHQIYVCSETKQLLFKVCETVSWWVGEEDWRGQNAPVGFSEKVQMIIVHICIDCVRYNSREYHQVPQNNFFKCVCVCFQETKKLECRWKQKQYKIIAWICCIVRLLAFDYSHCWQHPTNNFTITHPFVYQNGRTSRLIQLIT